MSVVLYSTNCPRCKVLKLKLEEKNISFVENNDKEEMLRLGFIDVPVLKVNNIYFNFIEAVNWIREYECGNN